jgi:hypothetical protein
MGKPLVSEALAKRLGSPLVMGYLISGKVYGENCGDCGGADLSIPVSGPMGHGVLQVWEQESFVGAHICSATYKPEQGEIITIVPDKTCTDRE